MKRTLAAVIASLCLTSVGMYAEMQESDFNLLDQVDAKSAGSLVEIISQTPAPENVQLICSALKRIRELHVTEARDEVRELIDACVPSANQNAQKRTAWMRVVFNMGVKALGAISKESNDAVILYHYYQETWDDEGRYWIVIALGGMTNVPAAVDKLGDLANEFLTTWKERPDERLLAAFLDGAESQNSRKLVLPLYKLENKLRLSPDLYDRTEELIKKLNARGNP
jgi:hypothetical protein